MTHICVSKLAIIGSDNGLAPTRRQAIIWTNAGVLLIRTSGTNFTEILRKIRTLSYKNIHVEMSSLKLRPFCPCLNMIFFWGILRVQFRSSVVSAMLECLLWVPNQSEVLRLHFKSRLQFCLLILDHDISSVYRYLLLLRDRNNYTTGILINIVIRICMCNIYMLYDCLVKSTLKWKMEGDLFTVENSDATTLMTKFSRHYFFHGKHWRDDKHVLKIRAIVSLLCWL